MTEENFNILKGVIVLAVLGSIIGLAIVGVGVLLAFGAGLVQ